MSIEALQQDVSVRPTSQLIGDAVQLEEAVARERRQARHYLARIDYEHEARACRLEMELDLVRAELRCRT